MWNGIQVAVRRRLDVKILKHYGFDLLCLLSVTSAYHINTCIYMLMCKTVSIKSDSEIRFYLWIALSIAQVGLLPFPAWKMAFFCPIDFGSCNMHAWCWCVGIVIMPSMILFAHAEALIIICGLALALPFHFMRVIIITKEQLFYVRLSSFHWLFSSE